MSNIGCWLCRAKAPANHSDLAKWIQEHFEPKQQYKNYFVNIGFWDKGEEGKNENTI